MIDCVICRKKNVQEAPFKIYSASAGSGKTYTLAKEYLKIVLSTDRGYRKILAITFTNKAVNEMKHRILSSLYNFGQATIPKRSKTMFDEICADLDLEPALLQNKSRRILKEILHNYSFFDISTIDKFTHRLIRTFARDLRLSQNFEVILDTDMLLDEAVSRLLDRAGADKKLTKVLIDFSLEKIDDNKSWDIAYDLNQIGKLLFNENHAAHVKKLENKTIDDFLALKKHIRNGIVSLEDELLFYATNALDLIDKKGLEFSDFSSSYFPKFMVKIQARDFKIDFNAGWKRNFDSKPLYNKSCPQETKTVLDTLHPDFIIIFNNIEKSYNLRSFLINAYGNIVPLTVLNEIQHEVGLILNERNQLSISEFNTIVSKEIKDQPAPFIYERLGEKYRHYFIDEFQDTSLMQWKNLIPLVGNALEGQGSDGKVGSLFLVGDGKQAIYRWRGGQVEQFLDMVNKTSNPFVSSPQIKNLPKNYRSCQEIVEFNNDFFSIASGFLQNTGHSNLFSNGSKQVPAHKTGGAVHIEFIVPDETKAKDETYCSTVLSTIQDVLKKGYVANDITVLVRDNNHGMLLAEFLTDNQINVVSSETLLIASSPKVRFLIDILRYCVDPTDLQTGYGLLSYLARHKEDKHGFIHRNLKSIPILLKNEYDFDFGRMRQESVYDGLEYAISRFDLIENSDAYITHLMDLVFEQERKEGVEASSFLSFWEKKKDQACINTPENTGAVQIMSIHKAKGLEFDIVIYPFANSHIYKRTKDKKLWVPVDPANYCGFDELLVNEKKEVIEYGENFESLFKEELYQMELDAFNVLYVALTRAVKALFVITEMDLTKDGEPKAEYYSGLFVRYLKEKGLWNTDKTCYTFGRLDDKGAKELQKMSKNVPYQYSYKEREGFRILAKSRMLWDTEIQNARIHGNLIHNIMGLIESRGDVPSAIKRLRQDGDIPVDEIDDITIKINQILDHPLLSRFFDEDLKVLNETDILTKEGRLLRPDRIVIKGKKTTLIDYKTGRKSPRYREQLYDYADTLEDMGYEVENKIIVYIDETINPEFI
ncbi:UvrD-helicase domain-containing protein [Maribacter algicola]|uniref:UvrD-helicase domain-containing protein n=1 Tax=Meishania litoralis TaxID=3434685 RepID=A0ACC7LML0_9FLAO